MVVTPNFLVSFTENPSVARIKTTKCFSSKSLDSVKSAYPFFAIIDVEKYKSSGAETKGAHYAFKVVLNTKKVRLACETAKQRDRFMRAIGLAITENREHQKAYGNILPSYISTDHAKKHAEDHCNIAYQREAQWRRKHDEEHCLRQVSAANALLCQLSRIERKRIAESFDLWKVYNLRDIKRDMHYAGTNALAMVVRNIALNRCLAAFNYWRVYAQRDLLRLSLETYEEVVAREASSRSQVLFRARNIALLRMRTIVNVYFQFQILSN